VTEQRYKAVQAVLANGRTVSEVAGDWSVSRRTMHRWLSRYEAGGFEGLGDHTHRPAHCPHQMPATVEVMVLEMRRSHPYWGARRIAYELARKHVDVAPSESAVYRCLVRAAVIDPMTRRRRRETWKRWERGAPMELWQLDVVHGFALAEGTAAKALTGIDDHSRFCVSACLMTRERTQAICDGFSSAMRTYGVPAQVLDVRRAVEKWSIHVDEPLRAVKPGRSVLVPQSKIDREIGPHLPAIVDVVILRRRAKLRQGL